MSSTVWRQTEFDFGEPRPVTPESSTQGRSRCQRPEARPKSRAEAPGREPASERVTPYELESSTCLKSFGNTPPLVSPEARLDAHRRRIAGYLTVHLPEPVDVVFTNNRSTMVSFRRIGGRLLVRLHKMFRHSDAELLESLALYLGRKDPGASARLDQFFLEHQDEIRTSRRTRTQSLRSQGAHQDLDKIFERVNRAYFDSRVDARIGWARSPAKRRKGRRQRTISRALATYSFDDRTIRVSPVLDSPDIPDYVLDWIVYHEMLHHVLPVEKKRGRRLYHTKKFHMLERAFPLYEEAKLWEKAHLDKLLS